MVSSLRGLNRKANGEELLHEKKPRKDDESSSTTFSNNRNLFDGTQEETMAVIRDRCSVSVKKLSSEKLGMLEQTVIGSNEHEQEYETRTNVNFQVIKKIPVVDKKLTTNKGDRISFAVKLHSPTGRVKFELYSKSKKKRKNKANVYEFNQDGNKVRSHEENTEVDRTPLVIDQTEGRKSPSHRERVAKYNGEGFLMFKAFVQISYDTCKPKKKDKIALIDKLYKFDSNDSDYGQTLKESWRRTKRRIRRMKHKPHVQKSNSNYLKKLPQSNIIQRRMTNKTERLTRSKHCYKSVMPDIDTIGLRPCSVNLEKLKMPGTEKHPEDKAKKLRNLMRKTLQKRKLKKKRLQAKSLLTERIPLDLPEEEMKELAGKTVRKGDDDYLIVVLGVETGLCGKYWGGLDNSCRRRPRSGPEQGEFSAAIKEEGDNMTGSEVLADKHKPTKKVMASP